MMAKVIPIPEGFSVELPSHDLVYDVSPFPVAKCFMLKERPIEGEGEEFVWVKVTSSQVGLFMKEDLSRAKKCPTCGRELTAYE